MAAGSRAGADVGRRVLSGTRPVRGAVRDW
jgi:hypothetical protein